MIFASAFDRIRPRASPKVTSGGVPVNALLPPWPSVGHRVRVLRVPPSFVAAHLRRHPGGSRRCSSSPVSRSCSCRGAPRPIWQNSALPKGRSCRSSGFIYVLLHGFKPVALVLRQGQRLRRRLQEQELHDLHGHPVTSPPSFIWFIAGRSGSVRAWPSRPSPRRSRRMESPAGESSVATDRRAEQL